MKGNPFRQRRLFLRVCTLVCIVTLIFFGASPVFALPSGEKLVSGQAAFDIQGHNLTITNSPNAIIHWRGFSIDSNEAVRFVQQYPSSAVLNRVIGQDPSRILGLLQSNGRVFLVNPNGILFAPGARIDVNGLVASTLDVGNQDFLAGRYNFTAGAKAGSLQNQGTITTPGGGQVFLIAPDIENSGIITSPRGDVLLAAGHSVQLIDSLDPDIAVVLSASENSAVNLGQIIARSGTAGIYGGLISQKGIVNADSVVVGENGRIFFRASRDVTLESGSKTSVSGPQGGQIVIQGNEGTTLVSGFVAAGGDDGKGGEVQILGRRVGMTESAQVDVSGSAGGGAVLVGGDYKGENPSVQNAEATYVGKDVVIKADALDTGDGGKVIVWSDGATRAYGSISARGGTSGGDGGFVETSGGYLDVNGARVNTFSSNGRCGAWLLDPSDITITATGSGSLSGTYPEWFYDPAGATGSISWSTIEGGLAGGNVTVATSSGAGGNGDITADNGYDFANAGAGTLTLDADRDITINSLGSAITGNPQGITLHAARNVFINNGIDFASPLSIAADTGDVVVNAPLDVYTASLSITAAAGDVFVNAPLTASTITASGQNIAISSAGGMSAGSTASLTATAGSIGMDNSATPIGVPTLNLNAVTGIYGSTATDPFRTNYGGLSTTINANNSGAGPIRISDFSYAGLAIGSSSGVVQGGAGQPIILHSAPGMSGGLSVYGPVTTNNGDIVLTTSQGVNFTAAGQVTSGAGIVKIQTGLDYALNMPEGSGIVTTSGNIDIMAGDVLLAGTGARLASGTGMVLFSANNTDKTMKVGASTPYSGALTLEASDFPLISTNRLVFNAANIYFIDNPFSLPGGELTLKSGLSGGVITQDSPASIHVPNLAMTGYSDVILTNPSNTFSTVAADLSVAAGKDLQLVAASDLTIGSVNGYSGLLSNGGDVSVESAGAIVLTAPVAGATNIYLAADGGGMNVGADITGMGYVSLSSAGEFISDGGTAVSGLHVDIGTTATGNITIGGTVSSPAEGSVSLNVAGDHEVTTAAGGLIQSDSIDLLESSNVGGIGTEVMHLATASISGSSTFTIGDGEGSGTPSGVYISHTGDAIINSSPALSPDAIFSFMSTGALTVPDISTGSSDLTLKSASGGLFLNGNISGGNIFLHNGEPVNSVSLGGFITATGNVRINSAGPMTDASGFGISASGLELVGAGSFDLTSSSLHTVHNLAGNATGNISFANAGATTVGTVNTTSGLTSGGAIDIMTAAGDLTISKNISTTNATPGAIRLNAAKDASAGTAAGGNIILSGSPTITTGAGGFATLYSGSVAGSTGLTDLVGSGSGRFRYSSDETTTNYTVELNSGINAIYREQPSLTVMPDDYTSTYGEIPVPTAFVLQSGSLLNGDPLPGTIGGTIVSTGDATSNVGAYDLSISGASAYSDQGYALTTVDNPGGHTINPAPLFVTANNYTKTYDGISYAGGNGVGYSGFVNGETSSVLGGTLVYGGSSQGAVNAGSYPITPSGLTSGNYAFTYYDGTLTIDKAPLFVTANNFTKTYDGISYAGGNGVDYSGFVNGETSSVLGGALVYGGSSQGAVNVGNYPITPSGLTSGNYAFTYYDGTLTIDKAPLFVTANNFTKTYDGISYAGGNGVDYSGFVNGETSSVLGGTLVYGGSSQGAVNAGSYPITPSGLTSGNYAFTYYDGTLTIDPVTLTITATGVSKVYDGLTEASVTLQDNRVAGDTLTTAYTEAAYTDKHVGVGKTVNVSGITLDGADVGNYTYNTMTSTTADIMPRTLTVSAAANTKGYDGNTSAAAVPVITAGSLVGGDTAALSEVYDSKFPGTGKTLIPAAVISDGNGGRNYMVSYINNLTGVIESGQTVSGMLDMAAAGKTIAFAVDGTLLAEQASTSESGKYSCIFPLNSIPANSVLLAYLVNDSSAKSASVYLATGGDIASLPLSINTVIAGSGGGTLSNTTLGIAKGTLASGDIPYSVSGTYLAFSPGVGFKTTSGTAYSFHGTISTANGFQSYNGPITLAGNTVFSAGTGNISFNAPVTGTGYHLTINSQGMVTQTAPIAASGLELLGAGGTYNLTDRGNAITILAGNTGTVNFANGAGFDVGTVNETSGLVTSGDITLSGVGHVMTGTSAVASSGGTVSITAYSPLTIGSGGVFASDDITLNAAPSGSSDDLTINGEIYSSNGNILLSAGNRIVLGPEGSLHAPRGSVTFSDGGSGSSDAGNTTAAGSTAVALEEAEEIIAVLQPIEETDDSVQNGDDDDDDDEDQENKDTDNEKQTTDNRDKKDGVKQYCN